MTKTTPKTPKTPKTQKNPRTPKTPKRKEPKQDENSEIKENDAKRSRQQPDLMNFFKPKEKPTPPPTVPQCMPNASLFKTLFQLKEGMTLAPSIVRKPLTEKEHEQLLDVQSEISNYLVQCNKNKVKKKTASNTDEMKAKYFHFHDNHRPPYYGTWRQRSSAITGRRPFCKKEKLLNYEYDSDEDWEDEPADADECKSDDEEVEKDDQVDSEDDDGFFVDHGYLSTDEGSGAEENGDEPKKSRGGNGHGKASKEKNLPSDDTDEEQRRQRLELKAQEWKDQQRQKERRYKKHQLIPIVYLPAEGVHQLYQRYILPGILFDYSKIVKPNTEVPSTSTG